VRDGSICNHCTPRTSGEALVFGKFEESMKEAVKHLSGDKSLDPII
jgi:hypothetical protein